MEPIIQSLYKFKQAVNITELWNHMTGGSKKAYHLIYGFKGGNHYITNCNNWQEAFECYLFYYQHYDKFIPANSFLRD